MSRNGDEDRRGTGDGQNEAREREERSVGGREGSNDEFHPCTVVQFYSAEFVCAADCLGSDDGSNESELKRSIKNVNSPNWDVKWHITVERGKERKRKRAASPRSDEPPSP